MASRVWFVTGASSGIGLALVKMLLNEGERVAATSRNLDDLTARVGAASDSESFLPLHIDVADEDAVHAALEAVVAKFGGIDVLVNNAGYAQLGAIEELSDSELRAQFDVNVFAVFNVLRHGVPYLRERRGGYIFNVSSVAGFTGFAESGAYCASKFAVDGLSHSLLPELSELGIRVVSVKPGAIDTNFFNAATPPKNRMDAYRREGRARAALQRLDVDVVAAAIVATAADPAPPFDLFIGEGAYAGARRKLVTTHADMERTAPAYDL